jgi:hypothetical protein
LAQPFNLKDRVARQGSEFQHMHGQSEGAPAAISKSPTEAALVGGSAGNGCNGSAHTPDNSQNPTPLNFQNDN